MTNKEEETALLHQQASTKYLQGEFEQALEVWRRLLELDPQDERAQEGVRLCEMLAEDGDTTPAPSAASPVGETGGPAPSTDGGIDELEGLLDPNPAQAAAAGGAPPQPAEEDVAQDAVIQFDFSDLPPEAELPDPNRQAEGIDVGDVGQMATIGLDAPGADPGGLDFAEIDAKLGAAPTSRPAAATAVAEATAAAAPVAAPVAASAGTADASASELSLRIRALHAEALEAHQAGNPDEALAVLSRLFILNENDPAARELEQLVRAQAAPPVPVAEPAPHDPTSDPILEQGGEEIALDLDAVARNASGNEVLDALDGAAEQDPRTAVRTPRTLPTAASAKRSQPLLTKLLIGATVVVGLAAAGFYLVPKFMGGSPAQPAEPSPAKTATQAKTTPDGPGKADGPAADPSGPPQTAAATPPPLPVDELLVQGQQAMDEARYADAVLSYKQILDADPDHQQARQLLLQSGELYREQQEQLQKWQNAIAHFNEGRYQDALRAFYRLPEDEQAERLERYKRNGWFNMGRQSLRSGDCAQARSHFKEARAIDPEDEGIRQALELCSTCLLPQKEQSYFDAVSNMRERGLED